MNIKLPANGQNVHHPNALANDVIERLYEVAVDPTRYEELLDQWELLISPYRRAQNLDSPIALSAIDFESHFLRASRVLDSIPPPTEAVSEDAIVARFDRCAAFTIGRDLTVGGVNDAAAVLFSLRRGASIAHLPLGEDEQAALADQITRLLGSNSDQPTMFRARVSDKSRLMVVQLRVLRPADAPPYVIAVSSELIWPKGFDTFLKSVFDLTDAEAQVLHALSECHSIKEIADMRGRSVETVRVQLKSLQAKTETRSQAELVRLTLSTMDIATFTLDAASDVPLESRGFETLEPRPFRTLTLADGRRFDYLVLGDPDGRPCFFGPQDYGLVRWPASAEAEAARRGIKIIVPVRAGFGQSTQLPRGSVLSKVIIDDYAQLFDHLGISACPMISLGGDFFFSAHFHDAHPDRVTALIACAGVLPITRPEQYERMEKWHRFILAGARYTPHLLPFMVKAGFALARRLGKHGFVRAVYGNSPADVETFEQPEVFEAMVIGSEVALSKETSAHAAFSVEVIEQETTDWRGPVTRIQGRCPVHFLNGLQDPQIPAATLAELRQDYPWIDFAIYPDAGQLIFFLKWRDVLDMVEKYL